MPIPIKLRHFIIMIFITQILGLRLSLWASSSQSRSSLIENRKESFQIQSQKKGILSVLKCVDLFRSEQTHRTMTSQVSNSLVSRLKTQFFSSGFRNLTKKREQQKNAEEFRTEKILFNDFDPGVAEKTDLSLKWINKSEIEKFIQDGQLSTQKLKNDELLLEIKKLFKQDLLPLANSDLSQRELSQYHLKSFFFKRYYELQNQPRLITEYEARKNFQEWLNVLIVDQNKNLLRVRKNFNFRVYSYIYLTELFSRPSLLLNETKLNQNLLMSEKDFKNWLAKKEQQKKVYIQYLNQIDLYLKELSFFSEAQVEIDEILKTIDSPKLKVKKLATLLHKFHQKKKQDEIRALQSQIAQSQIVPSQLTLIQTKAVLREPLLKNEKIVDSLLDLDAKKRISQDGDNPNNSRQRELSVFISNTLKQHPEISQISEFWEEISSLQNQFQLTEHSFLDSLHKHLKLSQLNAKSEEKSVSFIQNKKEDNDYDSEAQQFNRLEEEIVFKKLNRILPENVSFTSQALKELQEISWKPTLNKIQIFLEILKSEQWLNILKSNPNMWDYHKYIYRNYYYGDDVRTVDLPPKGTRLVFKVVSGRVIIYGINIDKIHTRN